MGCLEDDYFHFKVEMIHTITWNLKMMGFSIGISLVPGVSCSIFQGNQPLGFKGNPHGNPISVAGLLLVPVLSLTGLEVLSRWVVDGQQKFNPVW